MTHKYPLEDLSSILYNERMKEGVMRERYTTTVAWLRHEQPIVNVEETCELGTRVIKLPLDYVIQSAANRHLDRMNTLALRWGSRHYPRLTYHGKS